MGKIQIRKTREKKKGKNMSNPDWEQPGKTQARNPARNAEAETHARNTNPKRKQSPKSMPKHKHKHRDPYQTQTQPEIHSETQT